MRGTTACTIDGRTLLQGLDHSRVCRQPEIIITAKRQHRSSIDGHTGRVWSADDATLPNQMLRLKLVQLLLQTFQQRG
jgi:hypothetical protein